jgi:hypothetical protein
MLPRVPVVSWNAIIFPKRKNNAKRLMPRAEIGGAPVLVVNERPADSTARGVDGWMDGVVVATEKFKPTHCNGRLVFLSKRLGKIAIQNATTI